MIQSHLLQVMAVVAMEPPLSMDARDLRDRKEEVMRSTRAWADDPVGAGRRARYSAGTIGGRELPAYVDEAGVDPSRDIETLAEMTLEIDSWRWAGVPFRLRSGKALSDKRKEIIISFKPVPRQIPGLYGTAVPAQLVISLGPEKISLDLNINGADEPFELEREHLVAELNAGRLPAYSEVLDAVFRGDPTLSVRGDTAEECWRIVDPVLAAWRAGAVPIEEYPAGSAGPAHWTDPSIGLGRPSPTPPSVEARSAAERQRSTCPVIRSAGVVGGQVFTAWRPTRRSGGAVRPPQRGAGHAMWVMPAGSGPVPGRR